MSRRRSDKDRYTALMRPHFDALYAAALRLVASRADAEDLVQDVSVKAFLHIDELAAMDYPRAWLLKILYHQFVDGRRAQRRTPVDMADTGEESQEPERTMDGGARPDDVLYREQRLAQVSRALGILDRESGSLLALHDIEGYSVEELQQMTGMPAGTIKSKLHRTRSKLGRLLSNEAIARPRLTVVGSKP